MVRADEDAEGTPWLEHRESEGEPPIRIDLDRVPFRIGRSNTADFVIHSSKVSKEHAEITCRRGMWIVSDLGSRNGTFVNGEKVTEPRRLRHGDVLHLANKSFGFRLLPGGADARSDATLIGTSAGGELAAVRDLLLAIGERRVYAVFQPIVTLDGRTVAAYESLGRCELPSSRKGISELFKVAEEQGRAGDLARVLREAQVADAPHLPGDSLRVFFNVHPEELVDEGRWDRIAALLSGIAPRRVPVLEVHERTITDLGMMARLRAMLSERGIELAYDDFGAGQSRLMELVEVPPDYIKLDLSIVRGIDQSSARQGLVAALTRVMKDLGIRVLAEGIETAEELETVHQIGCDLGQGYFLGKPARVADLVGTVSSSLPPRAPSSEPDVEITDPVKKIDL